jgi:hypothetical protein
MEIVFKLTEAEILEQAKLSCLIPAIVEAYLTRKIIFHTTTQMGISVKPEEVQLSADGLRLLNQLYGSEDTWDWLEKHYLSLDDFETIAALTTLSTKLAQHLFADQVEPYFYEHQLDYLGVVLYEVVLDDEDLAQELAYALQEGEANFHQVAHHYIQDVELRRRGGYRGTLRRTELKPEISAAVFAAKPPQILKPILTAQGTHLILVEEFIPAQLNESTHNEILSKLFTDWLKQELEKYQMTMVLPVTKSALANPVAG